MLPVHLSARRWHNTAAVINSLGREFRAGYLPGFSVWDHRLPEGT
jgi:hypothetical protein